MFECFLCRTKFWPTFALTVSHWKRMRRMTRVATLIILPRHQLLHCRLILKLRLNLLFNKYWLLLIMTIFICSKGCFNWRRGWWELQKSTGSTSSTTSQSQIIWQCANTSACLISAQSWPYGCTGIISQWTATNSQSSHGRLLLKGLQRVPIEDSLCCHLGSSGHSWSAYSFRFVLLLIYKRFLTFAIF